MTTDVDRTPQLGRRLPQGARFTTVEQLYALPDETRETTEVWTPNGVTDPTGYGAWMRVADLLPFHSHRSTLAQVPSGMVVVVRDRAPD